jgi:phosphatidate phosphatase PAH1
VKYFRKESWQPFKLRNCDFDKQEVYISNHGNVKRQNLENGDLEKTNLGTINKFSTFWYLRKDGKKSNYYMHRAVALLFLDNPENHKFVIHLDHDLQYNHLSNLKWVGQKELTKHQLSNPLRQQADKLKNYKLTEGRVRIIKRKIFNPNRKTRMKMIAKQFGISTMQLYRIKTGENWGHVTDY